MDGAAGRSAVLHVIDRYNEMLAGLATDHSQFHHVDLRPMLDPDYDWSNELHLRNSAYARAADQIHQVISKLP